ncbi:hemerythrin domain-containing protein [Aquipuribacter sp. SD81]|uniref:hemerythrin domain-containing protein n=1 Tax=Aquipuribacter sp. SD81 TaxID=3127703 RepID=UPI003015CFAB
MTTTSGTTQVDLPGQAHVADGPHDQTGMYLMHHAFRRDLGRFEAAARATPVEAAATWRALEQRWHRFGEVLHHHHTVEDDTAWPLMKTRATEAGEPAAVEVLDAMEAEHDQIDPALHACGSALRDMVEHPCSDHRNALAVTIASARAALLAHLAHEETDALPLWQRLFTAADHETTERAARSGYPASLMFGFMLPWMADELPEPVLRRVLADAPPGYGLALRLARIGYERKERRAFGYA